MAESASVRSAIFAGGVSKQKPEVRSPGQCEDALNMDFTLKRGADRRAGTVHQVALGASMPASFWKFSQDLENGEKLRVFAGSDGSVKVLNSDGTIATVVSNPFATTYLNGLSRRPAHAGGKTGGVGAVLISNPSTVPLAKASPSATATGEALNFDTLCCNTTTSGSVWRVLESTTLDRPAGLYRYQPGTVTTSTAKFALFSTGGVTTSLATHVSKPGNNPMGCRLWFPKFALDTAAATYTAASRTVTIANAFTNYTFAENDKLFVSGVGVGAWEIESKVDASNIVLKTSPGAFATLDVRGIGMEVAIEKDFSRDVVSSGETFALALQKAIRDAGATSACVAFDPEDKATDWKGYFTLTNHYSGALANFNASGYISRAPSSGAIQDITAANWVFNGSPTITNGSGDGTAKNPSDRWVSRPVNDQADAMLDETTMPVALKVIQGLGQTTTYNAATNLLRPIALWRLGERYGTVAADTIEDAPATGTYTGGPTLGANSLVTGDTNGAVTFGAGKYVVISNGIPNLTSRNVQTSAVVAEFLYTSASTNRQTVFVGKATSASSTKVMQIDLNYTGSASTAGHIYFSCTSTRTARRTTNAIANLNDGNKHHVVLSQTGFWFDGALVATTDLSPAGPFAALSDQVGYATISDNTNPVLGTLDEFCLHHITPTDAFASWRNNKARGNSTGPLYMLDTEQWAFRANGDSVSNPTPAFIRDALPITAMANWQNRRCFGAGRTFSASRSSEESAFYVKDVLTVTDAAPIDRVVTASDASSIRDLTVFGSICFATTDGKQHYELSAAGALAIGTLNVRAGVKRPVTDAAPVLSGDLLYMIAPSDGDGGGQTLLELSLNEQAVQVTADDQGQHVSGFVDPAGTSTFVLIEVPAEGLMMLVQIGSDTIYTYRTAYVGGEKRQAAWSKWTIGGTIKAACSYDTGASFTVLRSGKYLEETWKPQAASLFPASCARMDGQLSGTGTFAAGNTTWTLGTDIPATGIDRVVTAAGVEYTASGTGSTVTVTGVDLSGGACLLGRWFDAYADQPDVFVRDQNGMAVIGSKATPSFLTITATDVTKVRCKVTVDSRSEQDYPVRPLSANTKVGRAWTRGPSGRTRIRLSIPGVAPVSIGAIEQIADSQGARR